MAIFDFISNAISKLGDFGDKNPEQLSILLDMLGSNISPDNAFRGIGTHFGQSSLADKGAQESKNMHEGLMESLIKSLTEGGKPGGNQVSIKMGPEGRPVVSTSTTLDSADSKALGPQSLPQRPVTAPNDNSIIKPSTAVNTEHDFLDSIAIK